MNTPPFLLGAALAFWGWQIGFPIMGAVLGAVLESSHLVKSRWEISDKEFGRIWFFCTIFFLAIGVIAFGSNGVPESIAGFLSDPTPAAQNNAGGSSVRTASALLRWMPAALYLFMLAQAYSSREGIPLSAISYYVRQRLKHSAGLPEAPMYASVVNFSYPFFVSTLIAASAHASQNNSYFYGLCPLTAWALWPLRSKRFGIVVWGCAMVIVFAGAYSCQKGIARLARAADNYSFDWMASMMHGSFDPAKSRTQLGKIGRIKNSASIAVRIEIPKNTLPPEYLREASYRLYKSQVWFSGTSKEDFANVSPELDLTTWVLLPGKRLGMQATIAAYLPGGKGLLPLPTGIGRLENLAAYILQTNGNGAVLAEGPGLVVFDALYGPGKTFDAPPDESQDLEIPSAELDALDRTIEQLGLRGKSEQEVLKTLHHYFENSFTYSLWQKAVTRPAEDQTPISRFLLRTHSGNCEYFASATTLLLRRLGIETRYAVGYSVHEGSGTKYVARDRDAHAWCLVWNKGTGTWMNFDTTPGTWIEAEESRQSVFQSMFDLWSDAMFQFSKFRWGQSNWRQYIIWLLAPVLGFLLYQIVFQARKKRGKRGAGKAARRAAWPGMDSEFYQLEQQLARNGFSRGPAETVSAWLRRVIADPSHNDAAEKLQAILHLHYRYRFDPRGLSAADRESLRRNVRDAGLRSRQTN